MLYKYNTKTLNYQNVTGKLILLGIGILCLVCGISISIIFFRANQIKYLTQETKEIIIKEYNKENEFSRGKLKQYLIDLNVKFPHIVMAQAELESGGFKSQIFKTNNNFIGMKEAKLRPSTNKGTENGHAYYEDWRACAQDYALYQASYLKEIKTESEYFDYLKLNYAEDVNYIEKLKVIIKKHNNLLAKK